MSNEQLVKEWTEHKRDRWARRQQAAYERELQVEKALDTRKRKKAEMKKAGMKDYEINNDGYDPLICDIVKELVMDGKPRRLVAKEIGVALSTLALWSRKYPELHAALNPHEEMTNEIEMSVFGRAKGYKYKAQKPMAVRGEVEIVEYEEQALPDMTAAKMWLQAHNPQKWSDKSMVAHEVGGLRDMLKQIGDEHGGLAALDQLSTPAVTDETPSE